MCGIAGFITKEEEISKKDYRTLLQLTIVNESRGEHSTGISLMRANGNVKIYKAAQKASEFIPKQVDKYRHGLKSIITHTRYATVGKTTKNNAHPFNYGNITGVHNGSVENYLKISDKAKVDSQVIFQQLDKYNNNFKKAFKKLIGQFAIAWQYKKMPDKIFLVRKDNPLFLIETKRGYFFSSQEAGLSVLLFDQKFRSKEIKENTVLEISTYSKIEKYQIKFKVEKPESVVSKAIKGAWDKIGNLYKKEKATEDYYGSHYEDYYDDYGYGKGFDRETYLKDLMWYGVSPYNFSTIEMETVSSSFASCENCGAEIHISWMYKNGRHILCGDCLKAFYKLYESKSKKAKEKKQKAKEEKKEKQTSFRDFYLSKYYY